MVFGAYLEFELNFGISQRHLIERKTSLDHFCNLDIVLQFFKSFFAENTFLRNEQTKTVLTQPNYIFTE